MTDIYKKRIFIRGANVYTSKLFFVATTILGPCVAVCLKDEVLGYAGINHYMLPSQEDKRPTARYGDFATTRLIEKMIALGSKTENIVAKVFGGIESSLRTPDFEVGRKNALIAQEILRRENIPVVALDVGGDMGRKLVFDSMEGSVRIKYFELGKD